MYSEKVLVQEDPSSAPPPGAASSQTGVDRPYALETRFGTIEVDPRSVVQFKSGLLGFNWATGFVVIDLDNPKHRQFRVLQCVTDPKLSFIAFPPSLDSALIARADIEAAAESVRFPTADLVVLLLVTVRRSDDSTSLSVNLRAPVLIDSARFLGVQYVMPGDKYPVRATI